ncbi:sensor histidine kinase [Segnochrobactraceae bacterium EtOH-i3]
MAETGTGAEAGTEARAGTRADRRLRGRWLLLLLAVGLMLGLVVDRVTEQVVEIRTLDRIGERAEGLVTLQTAMLRAELDKQRALPLVLAEDPDVRQTLLEPTPERLAALDDKFRVLAEGTRAGVIYLLDVTGRTLAASNAGTPESFVGFDYSFRPYFHRAMSAGGAEHFALGSVSHAPGLYLTRRISLGTGAAPPHPGVSVPEGTPEGALGVIVVKVAFDAVEADWRRLAMPAYVTDTRGIVLVTSVDGWRFDALTELSPETRAEIRTSLQFGDAPLARLPVRALEHPVVPGLVVAEPPGSRAPRTFMALARAVPTTDWTLHLLAPTEPEVMRATLLARGIALAATVALMLLAAFGLWRWRRAGERRSEEARARAELEDRVAERTAALSDANGRLLAEAEERRRAESALAQLRDERAQVNRLAIMGQIAASVAHEINQPVAAIRTTADNSAIHLERGNGAAVARNLTTIASLTERIGAITGQLRSFGRRSATALEPVPLGEAIRGALLLLGHRLKRQGVELEGEEAGDGLLVLASRIRLEQVFVNLFQNALDAMDGAPDGVIRLIVAYTDERVRVSVLDSGPGLAPEVAAALFTPFRTTKPRGLGLGLVICHDIVTGFAGTLSASNRPEGGACFVLDLKRVMP